MNPIDSVARFLSPAWALKREHARRILGAYEAAKKSRTRKGITDNRSGNAVVGEAAANLRGQARHLEQNHDLAKGILNALVNYTVGAKGISIEPQPFNLTGEINKEFAEELGWYFKEWSRFPETTHQMSWAKTQRMMARAWFRDGEVLSKSVMGNIPALNHRTKVPYSIELLEADYLADITRKEDNVIQGVQLNAWGQAKYFLLYETNPNDSMYVLNTKTRSVNADVIDHIKMCDRLRQVRGVSVFASVMNRLNDLKDYEESERIAAKIAASMAAFIRKGSSDSYMPNTGDDADNRIFEFSPGMIWDNLMPGEDVGTIQSNRPSVLLEPFRNAMLKAIASGTSAGYSSISKSYDGTYSAQRQELVEQWIHYAALSDDFINMFIEPVWKRFVDMAVTSGVVKVPPGVDMDTIFDADYLTPSMPWIDPKKEAEGHEKLLSLRITSPQKIIRQRGDNPTDVLDQQQKWQEELLQRNLQVVQQPATAGNTNNGGQDADEE